jgi:hypothetical protein
MKRQRKEAEPEAHIVWPDELLQLVVRAALPRMYMAVSQQWRQWTRDALVAESGAYAARRKGLVQGDDLFRLTLFHHQVALWRTLPVTRVFHAMTAVCEHAVDPPGLLCDVVQFAQLPVDATMAWLQRRADAGIAWLNECQRRAQVTLAGHLFLAVSQAAERRLVLYPLYLFRRTLSHRRGTRYLIAPLTRLHDVRHRLPNEDRPLRPLEAHALRIAPVTDIVVAGEGSALKPDDAAALYDRKEPSGTLIAFTGTVEELRFTLRSYWACDSHRVGARTELIAAVAGALALK